MRVSKLIFYSLFALLLHQSLFSQDYKNKFIIEGNFSLNSQEPNSSNTFSKSFSIETSPSIGYFIHKNLIVGAGIDYGYSREYQNLYIYNTTGINTFSYAITGKEIAPMAYVKLFKPLNQRMYCALRLNYQYGWSSQTKSSSNYNSSYGNYYDYSSSIKPDNVTHIRTSSFAISPEIQYRITKHWGIQTSLNGFNLTSIRKKDGPFIDFSKQTTCEFSINPSSWSFGVFAILGK